MIHQEWRVALLAIEAGELTLADAARWYRWRHEGRIRWLRWELARTGAWNG